MSLSLQQAMDRWPSAPCVARAFRQQPWWRPGITMLSKQFLQGTTWCLMLAYGPWVYEVIYDSETGECAELEPM
jgi:hypothetical protein